jgi:aldehyde:ferredoxin oxidoreductase
MRIMKPVVQTVERYARRYGWMNRILRVDLSAMTVRVQETVPYVPDFLGGRGLGAKLVWEDYPEPVDPFDPASPLMVLPGALTGSRSPYSGRTSVCAFSPQAYPYRWFTRSNVGRHLGGELKRAGYDALIVTGASDTPVRIRIRDDEVSILEASDLWGQDALDTMAALETLDGKGTRSMTIGPAGERLSRIATIQIDSSSACGHGGFGAVMGSKKLKAISVQGTGQVALADPERMSELIKLIGEEARSERTIGRRIKEVNERIEAQTGGHVRLYACTESCPSPCNLYYEDIPGLAYDRKWSGHMTCVGTLFQGAGDEPVNHGGILDWRMGLRGGMELNQLSNRYGLNQWELITSIVPWLEMSEKAGLISSYNGQPFDWQSPKFWADFLHSIAYREGLGDAIAEGGWAAARNLHLGEDIVRRYYTGWGFSGHWDGHACWHNPIAFPFWLVSALQWLTDTRDPIPSGHGYVHALALYRDMYKPPEQQPPDAVTWDHMRAIAQRIYGTAESFDPYSGYNAKAYPAFFHTKHSVMKDCLPVDDFVFPLLVSRNTEDHFARIGDIPGPSVEYHLFRAGTGTAWSEEEWERAAERIYTLERATQVRHWARDRQMDEMVLPSFEYRENWQNPHLDHRYALDREQFRPVMDEYYALRGWDVQTGWPTQAHLERVGLPEVYEPMVTGAASARERRSEPPVAEPVPLLHA